MALRLDIDETTVTPEPLAKADQSEIRAAKRGSDIPKGQKLVKFVKQRWNRFSRKHEHLQAELKVNRLRWEGQPWVQIDPHDSTRVYIPSAAISYRPPPTLNKIQRANDRYSAQIWADDPIMEGVPASHSDEDRDAAEAVSHILAGEWERGRLRNVGQRATELSGIYRSAFVLVDWDPRVGEKVPAQMYLDAQGQPSDEGLLAYVDQQQQPVEKVEDAAMIHEGNFIYKVGTPLNVRYRGSRYSHDATEVLWGEL